MKQQKKGFGGQWVDIFTAGTHHDDRGTRHTIDLAFLEQVVSNFKPEEHEPPAVIGHPKTDAPAYGWVCGLRVEGGVLQAQFCDDDPEFEEMVEQGKFKKRSSSFYLNAAKAPGGRVPQLRHVGFLGAQPPAVKGLREIQFGEGEAVTFETNFSEGESMDEEQKKTFREQLKEYFNELFGPKEARQPGSFSEADVQRIVDAAVARAEANFTEEIKKRDEKIETLTTQVGQHSGSATRAEIVSFCERVGAGRMLPAFKRMGVIEFMEQLAAADEKVTVTAFAEEGGREVEKKVEMPLLQFFESFVEALPPFVEFGEKFGGMKVTGSGVEVIDLAEVDNLREGMGMKKNGKNGNGGDK